MSREYDQLYSKMINLYGLLRWFRIYNIPGIKGFIYKYFSGKATTETKDELCIAEKYNGNGVVVSLTTFGDRATTVYKTIISLINQKMQPEHIVLWLDENEFNDDSIPYELKKLRKKVDIFDIFFCENLKSHKKYFFSIQNYPDSIIVTADDDVYYPSSWLEDLYKCHLEHPDCVCCSNAHRIHLTSDGQIDSYSTWDYLVPDLGPDILLCPIGVGGVLYPPNVFHPDVFEKKFIINNCFNADDLWLKIMTLVNSVKVVHISNYPYTFLSIKNSQKNALSKENVVNSKNDEQLKNILNKYGEQVRMILCEK